MEFENLNLESVAIGKRFSPMGGAFKGVIGNKPLDNGALVIGAEEKDFLVKKYPILEKYIKPYVYFENGEFIKKYCYYIDELSLPKGLENIRELQIVRYKCNKYRKNLENYEEMENFSYMLWENEPFIDSLVIGIEGPNESNEHLSVERIQDLAYIDNSCIVINVGGNYSVLSGILSSRLFALWYSFLCRKYNLSCESTLLLAYNTFPFKLTESSSLSKLSYAILDTGVKDYDKLDEEVYKLYGFENYRDEQILRELYKLYDINNKLEKVIRDAEKVNQGKPIFYEAYRNVRSKWWGNSGCKSHYSGNGSIQLYISALMYGSEEVKNDVFSEIRGSGLPNKKALEDSILVILNKGE